jgi:Ribbon-helix-helix protein, copG family
MTETPKQAYNVKLDPELIAALRAIKQRDGISESEQIRRGIRLWLAKQGGAPKKVKRS